MRSIFIVTSPAADLQLLTIEELRAAAGVAGSGRDAELTDVGRQASEAIARDCGVAWDGINPPTLLEEACSQTFYPARCAAQLRLARRPVRGITSLVVDGSAVDEGEFLLDRASGFVSRKSADWPIAEIAIDFTAGFAEPPSAMKLAAIKLTTALWAERGRDPSLKREEVDGIGTLEYWVSPSSDPLLSAEVSDLLSPYRERWF